MIERFQIALRLCATFGLMLSLLHCQGLSGGEEEEDCTLGQIQPCDCLLDGQLAVGTQVCGLYGEYDECECDSDGNRQANERSDGEGGSSAGEGGSGAGEGGSGSGEGGSGGSEGGSSGGEGGSGDEGTSSVDAELLVDPESLNFGSVPVGQLNVLTLTMTAKTPMQPSEHARSRAYSLMNAGNPTMFQY